MYHFQSTIGEFASISDKAVVSRLFLSNMHKLLRVTKEARAAASSSDSNSMQRYVIFSLLMIFRISTWVLDITVVILSVWYLTFYSFLHLNFRALLFDLAVSFLPGLNADEVDVLFNAIKPALQVWNPFSFHMLIYLVFQLFMQLMRERKGWTN